MRDSVVLSVGSTLLMGQYASFTLGEVAEAVLNAHPPFARKYGPVMVVTQGEPENDFVEVKGTDGAVADKLPSLVLKGIAMDGRGQPLGQVRLVATYDSLDVQQNRSWAQWADGKKRSVEQLWAALSGKDAASRKGGSASFGGGSPDEEQPDFGPEFMRKLKDAVLDMPEFEFTLREMSFTSGQFDPVTKSWSEPAGGVVNMDLTPHVSGDVKRAVDHIPGEHVVQSALAYMGGSGGDEDVRRGLTDIYRAFVERREEAYARAERERSGTDEDAEREDFGGASERRGGGRSRGGRRGGSTATYTQTQHGTTGSGGGGGTILDAEYTVRRDDPNAENR